MHKKQCKEHTGIFIHLSLQPVQGAKLGLAGRKALLPLGAREGCLVSLPPPWDGAGAAEPQDWHSSQGKGLRLLNGLLNTEGGGAQGS